VTNSGGNHYVQFGSGPSSGIHRLVQSVDRLNRSTNRVWTGPPTGFEPVHQTGLNQSTNRSS
jgi:hypothetical protein